MRMLACFCDAKSASGDGQELGGAFLLQTQSVAVQSTQCKIEPPWPSQKLTKAGGWWLGRERGDTAVSRAYTSLLNMGPPYICCNLAPVSARSEDNGGPQCPPFVVNFLVLPFSQNLKYFIRPPSVCSHSFATVL